MTNNTLYFVSFDTTDNAARTSIATGIQRLGQVLSYAGGWLIWSDQDMAALHSQFANLASGQCVVIPVDTAKFTQAGVLTSQAQSFASQKIRAA